MRLTLDTRSMDDYRMFLKVKSLPRYQFRGNTAIVPDHYAARLGLDAPPDREIPYRPSPFLFDYQAAIAAMAIRKRRFSVFADCGLGKTLIYGEFAMHAARALPPGRAVLFISPLMVVEQTIAEFQRWYGDRLPLTYIPAADLPAWLAAPTCTYAITNFEALTRPLDAGRLGCLIVDESSMLKSHYGVWGRQILDIGRGLDWKMAGTGTPAPNDRIEYANHAVFMGAFPNTNAFLARYFVNTSDKSNQWILKPHAVAPFYRSLADWSIFLTNPATYGWRDHAADIPPIHVHIETVPMTPEQIAAVQAVTGSLVATHAGGIGTRAKLGQIAKGRHDGRAIPTRKPGFIRRMVDGWPGESTIIWCLYNDEQDLMARTFPEAANIAGTTPMDERRRLIADFQAGRRRILITKPKILGYGLNLQVATRQVFSGLQDSYEQYYQAVKRSNRVGSTRPLNVHIPITDAERPMVENVLAKAHRVQADAEQQERIFREHALIA